MYEKTSIPSFRGVTTQYEKDEYTLKKYSSRNMHERLCFAEWGGGRGCMYMFCQQYTLFYHHELSIVKHYVGQHTHIAKHDLAPKLCLQTFIIDFL